MPKWNMNGWKKCERCGKHFREPACTHCALQDAVDEAEIAKHRTRIEDETAAKIAAFMFDALVEKNLGPLDAILLVERGEWRKP